jgi:hypothetical protein
MTNKVWSSSGFSKAFVMLLLVHALLSPAVPRGVASAFRSEQCQLPASRGADSAAGSASISSGFAAPLLLFGCDEHGSWPIWREIHCAFTSSSNAFRMFAHLAFGFLVALGCCTLLTTQRSPVLERSCAAKRSTDRRNGSATPVQTASSSTAPQTHPVTLTPITRLPSFRSSITRHALHLGTLNTCLFLSFFHTFGPALVAGQSCPVSSATSSHCSGLFKLGASHVPMLYMTEGSFAWVAVKYTSSINAAILQNKWTPSSKNFHVSHSILKSGIVVASDILMVEGSSSVYANMSTAAAFSTIRNNILAGCYWFKDTHNANDLTGWMRPYATGAQVPDAKAASSGQYPCCTPGTCNSVSWAICPPQFDCSNGVFLSSGNNTASHVQLNKHARMRSGAHSLERTHSIWLRIPLSTLVSASLLPASLPVPQGLIAMYTADSWWPAESLTTASWSDLSGAGNHVTDIGGSTSISVARPVGAPAYIYGAPTAWMKFPAGILPTADYTLFYVARYNGAARSRIFQGINIHWLSGFWGGKAGVALHDGDKCTWITAEVDVHGHDWVMGADRSDSFRSNGVDRTARITTCAASDTLAINNGLAPENSDFAIQSVLVYNRKLSDADVMKVEAWLTSQMPAFTPANLQASSLVGAVFHRLFLNS